MMFRFLPAADSLNDQSRSDSANILTGLRVSELLALKWSDADFENLELHVTRSIAIQRVGPCKTKGSQKPVPFDPAEVAVIESEDRVTYAWHYIRIVRI